MTDAGEHEEVVVGIDPARDWRLPLAWAVDEAGRRRLLGLRLVVAVPPQHDTQHVDDTPRSIALHQAASEALGAAAAWSRDRHPEVEPVVDLVEGQRRLLSETTAGWSQEYPDVVLTHEVLTGHPVEALAGAAEHALAVVVGRRGKGGYTGMRIGSVVHGLLHRAHCPVITVLVR
ncbi:universal stress protein [Streptomyces sp. NPDC090036]|uniref:universal stress protein n=1 Tax=Streptomyces sp. NPDC090036 TaxID=3365926 RepID=UPI003811B9F3